MAYFTCAFAIVKLSWFPSLSMTTGQISTSDSGVVPGVLKLVSVLQLYTCGAPSIITAIMRASLCMASSRQNQAG